MQYATIKMKCIPRVQKSAMGIQPYAEIDRYNLWCIGIVIPWLSMDLVSSNWQSLDISVEALPELSLT